MELAVQFEKELEDKMFLAKKDCKYPATRFRQMLKERGGVGAAKYLIQEGINGKVSDGFTRLAWLEQRPDLTLEDSVCKTEYQSLFTREEIEYCMKMLSRK